MTDRETSGPRFINKLLDDEAVRAQGSVDLIKTLASRKEEVLSRHDATIDSLLQEVTGHVSTHNYYAVKTARRNFAGIKAYFLSVGNSIRGERFGFRRTRGQLLRQA